MVSRMRRIEIAALLGLALVSGSCERTITSKEPDTSLPTAPVQPSAQIAQVGSTSVALSWTVASSTGIARYRVYLAEGASGDFVLRDSTTALSYLVTGLATNQQYRFAVASVNGAGVEGRRSAELSVTLAIRSISINSNALFTNNRTVTVSLNAAGATNLRLSEDPGFPGVQDEPFVSQKSLTLSSGDGIKRVYAILTLADGSVSDTLSDEITLDTRAFIDSVFFSPNTGPFDPGDTILFGLVSSDRGGEARISFPQVNQLRLYDDGTSGDNLADDGRYVARYIVPANLAVDNAIVNGTFTDQAGNAAIGVSAPQPLTIRAAPVAVQLAAPLVEPSFRVSINWTESPATDFSAYRVYRRTSEPVTVSSTLIETIAAKGTLTTGDTTALPGTKYYYRVFVFNKAGLSTGSNTDSITTPANAAPAAVTLAGSFTDSNSIRLTWTRSAEADFASYRVFRAPIGSVDLTDQLVTIINSSSTDTFTDFVTGTTMIYRVYVFDRFGLSTGSNEVIVIR